MIKMFDSECNFDIYGNVAGENNQIPAVQDQDQELADLLRKNKKFCHTPRTNWPVHEIKPVSEFSNTKIFCMEFPWLFPGRVGDIKDCWSYELDMSNWAQNLLYYQDGRFAKDKLWCFFTLKYIYIGEGTTIKASGL
jgi:hypothetical protein